MIPIPQQTSTLPPSQTKPSLQQTSTLPPSQTKPSLPIGEPVVKHRGRKKGEPRPPSRPMDIIYSDKMQAAFRSASLLVRRLKSLSRDKYVHESQMAREKYEAFLEALNAKVTEASHITGEVEEETLSDWTG